VAAAASRQSRQRSVRLARLALLPHQRGLQHGGRCRAGQLLLNGPAVTWQRRGSSGHMRCHGSLLFPSKAACSFLPRHCHGAAQHQHSRQQRSSTGVPQCTAPDCLLGHIHLVGQQGGDGVAAQQRLALRRAQPRLQPRLQPQQAACRGGGRGAGPGGVNKRRRGSLLIKEQQTRLVAAHRHRHPSVNLPTAAPMGRGPTHHCAP
jgi:hypothetical protein